MFDALKGCPGLCSFNKWDGYAEDIDCVCILINSHLEKYKEFHNDEHPFREEYLKILDFFKRLYGEDFVVN